MHPAYPLDAVVLLSGCDKTTPAMLIGRRLRRRARGHGDRRPMLRGNWRQEELGSGTDGWRTVGRAPRGPSHDEEWSEAESCMRSRPLMLMGTASTMASMAEALGMAARQRRDSRADRAGWRWPSWPAAARDMAEGRRAEAERDPDARRSTTPSAR